MSSFVEPGTEPSGHYLIMRMTPQPLAARSLSLGSVSHTDLPAARADRQEEATPVSSLELASASALQRVERLRSLPEADLRRFAFAAANERNAERLWDLMEAYLTLKGARGVATSGHTLRAYKRGLHELLEAWQGENLLRPSRDAGPFYVQRLLAGARPEPAATSGRGRRQKSGPLAVATVALRVAAARTLYDALAWSGATEADPFRDVRLGKPRNQIASNPSARTYSQAELDELLASCRDQQERVIVLLGAHAGLRVSEMLSLRWEDIAPGPSELLVRRGKGGKEASVALTRRLMTELLTYKRAAEAEGRSSVRVLELKSQFGVFNRLRKLCERAEVDFKGVHALRHSAGTRLYRQTGDLGQVQDHLRHATLDMARHYAKSDRRKLAANVADWD